MPRNLEAKRRTDRASKRRAYWANPEKARAAKRATYDSIREVQKSREWRAKNPKMAKENNRRSYENKAQRMADDSLKRLYGVSREQWEQKRLAQFNKCDVCGDEFGSRRKHIHVDHCHATGQIRSLLCHRCNAMLGYARDNPEILRFGANYIELWSSIQKKVA